MGMLDAACAGAVFTSPVPDQMSAASRAVDGGAGVLHIVKNYTGDVLNFRMAAELVEDDGIQVESVVMDDDVAVQDSLYTAGRRGTGATVLAEKLAGARPRPAARWPRSPTSPSGSTTGRARSVWRSPPAPRPRAARRSSISAPTRSRSASGIHGEPGRRRVKHTTAHEIAEMMVDPILEDLKPASGSSVLAFVNGLGGTPLLELYLLFNEVNEAAVGRRASQIERSLVGNYITSLEMAGASITLLVLDDELTGSVGCSGQHRGACGGESEGART